MGGNIDPKSSWWEYTGLNNGSFNLVMPPMFPSYATGLNNGSCNLVMPPMFPSYANAMLGGEEQRKFMVFDHSRDQSSLIYGSIAGTQHPSLHGNNVVTVTNVEHGHESEEMHENTEEIDALLYSESNHIDDDDDDEVMSTGHSPEELNYYYSSTPTKKRRLENKDFYDTSLLDTASSTSSKEGLEANKKLKRKRIQETVSMLRRIIPGGKGKDTAAVLDEAINYLRSLKLRFKKPLIESVDIMHQ